MPITIQNHPGAANSLVAEYLKKNILSPKLPQQKPIIFGAS